MQNRNIKKGFDIINEVEEIARTHTTGTSRKELTRYYTDIAISLNVWHNILTQTRKFQRTEYIDDINELRRELDVLKLNFKTLSKRLESSDFITYLCQKINEKNSVHVLSSDVPHNLCNSYIEMVSKIDIVKEIYYSYVNNVINCWTIIDAEPYDIVIREPIYNAQVEIYKKLGDDLSFDFHILNLSELHDQQKLNEILPQNANLIWRR